MVMGALNKLINETYWGHLDYLVVDTPPGTGDILLSLAQTVDISGDILKI
jgi:ATP-binding protein involved in chromosome partitioning